MNYVCAWIVEYQPFGHYPCSQGITSNHQRKPKQFFVFSTHNDPDGIRTRVMALKGPCPGPTRRQDQSIKLGAHFAGEEAYDHSNNTTNHAAFVVEVICVTNHVDEQKDEKRNC